MIRQVTNGENVIVAKWKDAKPVIVASTNCAKDLEG